MNKLFYLLPALLLTAGSMSGQRVMDKLDRGLIAVKGDNGNLVSWRVFGEDADNVKFNLYRDGSKLNSEPLTVSNYLDASGSTTSKYVVKTVVNGVEKETSKTGINFGKEYLEIKVAPVPSNADGKDISSQYEPNDATIADLDGDGQMEILIKMRNNTFHNAGYPDSSTDYDIIQVYKLDGTLMWWIDCGRNMVDFQSNEINIAAYDWDLDGKAECILRAADGTTIHMADGTTQVIGDPNADYLADARNNGMTEKFTHTGPEFLLYLNGETGKHYYVDEYPLKRLEDGEKSLDAAWGDGYGHRSSKHFFGAPYFDGRKPSIFIARGIYTRHKMIAYDVDPATHQLTERWRWFNNSFGPWYGQGYHNYTVADVDWDGRDEIVFGSMVIDDNGRGLSTTGLGHGDSHHVGDLNPYIYGSEVAACNEDNPNNNYRDATTSKIYYRTTGGADDGRAIAGNFSNNYPGSQFITSKDSQTLISTVTNAHIPGATGTGDVAQNFRTYWDGDLLDETFNYANGKNTAGTIYKYGKGAIATFTGTATNNDTKGTPCFQGDFLGDWREEIIMRSSDNKTIRIYSTAIPTEHRIYTLLHDPQYRNAMVWQMNGYNQTPHVSYFLGELEGITMAPPAPTMTGRTELVAGGSLSTADNGKDVVFAHTGDATATLGSNVAPALFVDNAPSWVQGNDNNDNITYTYYTHTLTGGNFTGDTKVVKLGAGTLVLPSAAQNHSGATEIWDGKVKFDGSMPNSHVWINRFGKLESDGGNFAKGIEMHYGSELHIGTDSKAGSLTTGELNLGFGSRVCLDIFAEGTQVDKFDATTLVIEKKDWENGPQYSTPVFVFTPHYANGATTLPAGEYELGTVGTITGNLADIKFEGLGGQKVTLSHANGKLMLTVTDQRAAAEIVWTGANGSVWDVNTTENFTFRDNGQPTVFVAGDKVIFDGTAATSEIELAENMYPSEVVFNTDKDLTIKGASFEGNVNIEKRGTGRVVLANTGDFTGNIAIYNGTLQANTLGANEGTETGALGKYTNPITIDGGVLAVNSTGKMSHPITIATEGGIEIPSGLTVTMTGAAVTGKGTLIKSGAGRLEFNEANDLTTLRIDGGVVYDLGDTHKLASNVVFNGKGVEFILNNSAYSYSSNSQNFEVTEGSEGKLSLDGRCDYTGKLTGKGTLEVYATWIRNILRGDWSEFEGTLKANQIVDVNSTVNKYGAEFTFASAKDMPKATLNILTGTTFAVASDAGASSARNNFHLGNLSGAGVLGGPGTYYVGADNANTSYTGTFGAVDVTKEGTGRLSLSKAQPNLKSLNVTDGELMLNSTSVMTDGSMTGTSAITINGKLSGTGRLGNSKVTFGPNAVISPSNTAVRYTTDMRTLYFSGDVVMDPAAEMVFQIVANTKYSSIVVDGNATLTPKASVVLSNYKPTMGDEFVFWTAENSSVKPSIQMPALPEGFGWDMSQVTAQSGKVVVSDHTGLDNIAADTEVHCVIVSVSGIVLRDVTTTAANVRNICKELGAGTYVVTYSTSDFEVSEKLVVK